jgi:uncharacterized protein DUF4339
VTQLLEAPLGDQEWMVQVTALDRRMMSTAQLLSELQTGKVNTKTLVWRGGMDDWMPVARIDELAQAGRQAPLPPPPRMGLGNLPLSPAAAPSQPVWSSSPRTPLGPPPAALPPPPSSVHNLPKPLPPPPVARASQLEHTNTARPVAVDFGELDVEPGSPIQGKRTVMALSAVAILAVCVTAYALLSGGENTANAETEVAAQPRAVNALQPATAKKEPEPSAAKTPEPKPAPERASEAASAAAEDEDTSAETASASALKQANAPARYSPRSEYRRRSRGSASDNSSADNESSDDEEEASAPEPSPRQTAAISRTEETSDGPAEVAAPEVADVDDAPKSTSKAGNTFNRDAAKAALDAAAGQAKNCRPQGGLTGSGRVQVRYEPSGRVAAVSMLTGKFENTTTGSCVEMLFRRAKVPEFSGAPVVVVNKSFDIP